MRSFIVPSSSNDPFQHKGTSECRHNASVRALVVNCAVPDLHQTVRSCITWMRLWRKRWLSAATCVSHQPHRLTPPCLRTSDAASPQWSVTETQNSLMLGGACTFRRPKPLGMLKGLREILWQTLEAGGTWSAATRIHQLGDASVDYSWLWQLNLHHCSVWDAAKFVLFRLGSAGPLEPNVCAVCHPGFAPYTRPLVGTMLLQTPCMRQTRIVVPPQKRRFQGSGTDLRPAVIPTSVPSNSVS